MADVVLSLMMTKVFVVNETIQAIYLGELISFQWKNLLPRMAACVQLGYDNGTRMIVAGVKALISLILTSFY